MLKKKYQENYCKRIESFINEIQDLNCEGIPELHLPLFGDGYEESDYKIAFIGRDTRSWGDMSNFIPAAKESSENSLYRYSYIFDNFEFTKWTNNFGKTFWDTAFKVLSYVHGIDNWKEIKRKQHPQILNSFVWTNINSVELYESTPLKNNVNYEIWKEVKEKSEKYIDSFYNFFKIFSPKYAFIFTNEKKETFYDVFLEWKEISKLVEYCYYKKTNSHIFRISHPISLSMNKNYNLALENLEKAIKIVH